LGNDGGLPYDDVAFNVDEHISRPEVDRELHVNTRNARLARG
jgi:hypothetical protein